MEMKIFVTNERPYIIHKYIFIFFFSNRLLVAAGKLKKHYNVMSLIIVMLYGLFYHDFRIIKIISYRPNLYLD